MGWYIYALVSYLVAMLLGPLFPLVFWLLLGLGCLWMCPRQVVVRYVDAVIPLGVALSWALLYDDLSSQYAL